MDEDYNEHEKDRLIHRIKKKKNKALPFMMMPDEKA